MDFLELGDVYRSGPIAGLNLQFIVWAIVIGFIISFFAIYYKRRVIGSFVRAIRNAEAIDLASAKTLAELGQEENISAISLIMALIIIASMWATKTLDRNGEEE